MGRDPILESRGFGRLMKSRREELAKTQQELADEIGVHISRVQRVEQGLRGLPNGAEIRAFASALQVGEDVLRDWGRSGRYAAPDPLVMKALDQVSGQAYSRARSLIHEINDRMEELNEILLFAMTDPRAGGSGSVGRGSESAGDVTETVQGGLGAVSESVEDERRRGKPRTAGGQGP